MKSILATCALACALLAGPALAQSDDSDAHARTQAFLDKLRFQTGDIAVSEADAHLDVGAGFHYLGARDARRVLEDFWGNPPDDSVLGMLVPDADPLGSEHSWAVVVTYSDDGYVSDADAHKIDYADLLKQMKQDTHDANDERKQAGYPTMELVGWAQPPRYDAGAKRLHWAKEISVEDSDSNVLNYDIRVLGRSGYLSLEAVSDMADLDRVNAGMTQVLPMARFDEGHRYADYQPGTDKLAAYGLAALVGGGIAAKAGLFAKLGALLLAFKKVILVGLAALAAFVKKLFGKKGGTVQ